MHLLSTALAFSILAPAPTAPLKAFVSIPPQVFLVEGLAGDLVDVEVLLPPGASPATYEPTPKQMVALERSRLYFRIGVPFEGPVLAKIADLMPDLHVIDCRAGVQLEPIESGGHDHGAGSLDPHIWLDPQRMKVIARTTAAALKALLPDAASGIEDRLATILREIDASDQRIAGVLAPYAGRFLLVFHPAYGYFTRRYGLIQRAVEVEGKAPSARHLAAIVEELQGEDVRALFFQPQFSRSAAERVAAVLDCRLIALDPLSRNYLENLETIASLIAGAMR